MDKDVKSIAKIAVASLVAATLATPAALAETPKPKPDYVKCYGVSAANKNDCGTSVSACASSVAKAGACYAWIYTPKNICEKLNNASVGAPAKDCQSPKA